MIPTSISVECGRLRRLEWLVHLGVALAGGWFWFGNAGAALLGLWVLQWRPPPTLEVTIPVRPRRVKLSRFAVTVYSGWRSARVFRDELGEDEFARLRRDLKASVARYPGPDPKNPGPTAPAPRRPRDESR